MHPESQPHSLLGPGNVWAPWQRHHAEGGAAASSSSVLLLGGPAGSARPAPPEVNLLGDLRPESPAAQPVSALHPTVSPLSCGLRRLCTGRECSPLFQKALEKSPSSRLLSPGASADPHARPVRPHLTQPVGAAGAAPSSLAPFPRWSGRPAALTGWGRALVAWLASWHSSPPERNSGSAFPPTSSFTDHLLEDLRATFSSILRWSHRPHVRSHI